MSQRAFFGATCCVAISQIADRRVLVRLVGKDYGDLGDQPFRELEKSLGERPLDLFFDLYAATGATMDVSSSWALWLRRHRARLGRVSMLTSSTFVRLSANTVRRFAQLGDKARLYADPAEFADAFHAAP
jgi:hypothetical protein